MSFLVRRYLNRTHSLEQLVETWQFDHHEAMAARDLDELVNECLDLARLSRRAWNLLTSRLFDEKEASDRVFAGEELIRLATRRTLAVFANVQKMIADAERHGYVIDGVAEFDLALRDVTDLENDTTNQWPVVDPRLIQESTAAFQRGEYRLAEDILHELESGGAEAH